MGQWGVTDSAIMPYEGWGVMLQINWVLVRLGAGGWVGVVFQVIALKGGKGSKVAALIFRIWCLQCSGKPRSRTAGSWKSIRSLKN